MKRRLIYGYLIRIATEQVSQALWFPCPQQRNQNAAMSTEGWSVKAKNVNMNK